MKSVFKIFLSIALLTGLVAGGAYYWHYTTIYPSTDDAYLDTNRVDIASQVSGKVAEIYVANNEVVKKNQLLVKIASRRYELAVDAAQAKIELVKQELLAQADAVVAAKAKVKQAQAQLQLAQKTSKRILTLVNQGKASKAEGDAIQNKLDVALASLNEASSELSSQQQKLGKPGDQNAQRRQAQAALAQARLDLSHTKIKAPHAGIINQFTLRVGDIAVPGQPLFALIEGSTWWITANFKETDLTRIKPGQHVDIKIDMYPNQSFQGTVDSISTGTGSAFSIMPPENATGNWVKVTQRIPVKIRIKEMSPKTPFRVGASATVTIDTQ